MPACYFGQSSAIDTEASTQVKEMCQEATLRTVDGFYEKRRTFSASVLTWADGSSPPVWLETGSRVPASYAGCSQLFCAHSLSWRERPTVGVVVNSPKSMFALKQPVFVMLSDLRSFWLFFSSFPCLLWNLVLSASAACGRIWLYVDPGRAD